MCEFWQFLGLVFGYIPVGRDHRCNFRCCSSVTLWNMVRVLLLTERRIFFSSFYCYFPCKAETTCKNVLIFVPFSVTGTLWDSDVQFNGIPTDGLALLFYFPCVLALPCWLTISFLFKSTYRRDSLLIYLFIICICCFGSTCRLGMELSPQIKITFFRLIIFIL